MTRHSSYNFQLINDSRLYSDGTVCDELPKSTYYDFYSNCRHLKAFLLVLMAFGALICITLFVVSQFGLQHQQQNSTLNFTNITILNENFVSQSEHFGKSASQIAISNVETSSPTTTVEPRELTSGTEVKESIFPEVDANFVSQSEDSKNSASQIAISNVETSSPKTTEEPEDFTTGPEVSESIFPEVDLSDDDSEEPGIDTIDWTALHYAANDGNLELVKNLIEDPNTELNVTAQNRQGDTALDLALSNYHDKIASYLINAKINQNNWTMLHEAASNGNLSRVKFLILKNADMFAQTKQGETALDLSLQHNGNAEMTNFLAENMTQSAIDENRLDRVKLLIEKYETTLNISRLKDQFGWTPLHHAADKGRLDIVKYLLSVLLNKKTRQGETALDLAKSNHRNEVVEYFNKIDKL